MRHIRSVWFFGLCYLLMASSSLCSNLVVSDLQLSAPQLLRFTIQWENHWRMAPDEPPYNHDAAWVFAQQQTSGLWSPFYFLPGEVMESEDGHFTATVAANGYGMLIRRQTIGSGETGPLVFNVPLASTTDGLTDIRLFGIELVYVPKGDFFLGDAHSNFSLVDANKEAYSLTSEEAIPVEGANALSALSDYKPEAYLPADYPKGHRAFYAMKYEISQEQFKDFLNVLDVAGQAAHTTVSPTSAKGTSVLANGSDTQRNGLVIDRPATENRKAIYSCNANADQHFNDEQDGQNRACNWLSWYNLSAYLDWAGLRPMTELEFEKATRGFDTPTPKAFAWGSQQAANANTTLFDGTPNEQVAESAGDRAGLANHGGEAGSNFLQGPLRTGFAANASTDRLSSGASYFGLMEMSGNLWEMVVNLQQEGLVFKGSSGDGILGAGASANQADWPDPTSALGAGYRGGAWNSLIRNDLDYAFRDLAISDRYYITLPPNTKRGTSGGRGVLYFE